MQGFRGSEASEMLNAMRPEIFISTLPVFTTILLFFG